jgi:hypothetical protein
MNPQDDRLKNLVTAIRSGSDLDTACHFAGLSSAEVYKWLERGKLESQRIGQGNQIDPQELAFYDLWIEISQARAGAIVRNVSTIQKAAQDGQWQAAAWWLERSAPEHYGKKQATSPNVEVKPLPLNGG